MNHLRIRTLIDRIVADAERSAGGPTDAGRVRAVIRRERVESLCRGAKLTIADVASVQRLASIALVRRLAASATVPVDLPLPRLRAA